MKRKGSVSVRHFLASLKWLDGTPLVVEPYRLKLFEDAFSVDENGQPLHSLVLCSRGKQNAKTLDLSIAALYSLLLRPSTQGSDCYILANDEQQAGDDLDLAIKLVRANPALDRELTVRAKSIERRDGRGVLRILPRDVAGAHGKTFSFIGHDEIHEARDHALLEALSPDPTRRDVLVWIASYDSLWHSPGRPLWDLYQRGRAGTDPRMLFSWYSGDYCTDPDFAALPPEQRANPSMASWANPRYLEEQRLRLPSARYRRLHLNLGGQPEGAALSAEKIEAAVVPGRKVLPYVEGVRHFGFCDMSGGSSDDACAAVAYRSDEGRLVLAAIMNQGPKPPFDPRQAVRRFVALFREYHVTRIRLDAYAGNTFRNDFEAAGLSCEVYSKAASDLYESLEAHLNAGEVELLDVPTLVEQLVGLVWKGARIGHVNAEHDDWANACAGALLQAVADRGAVLALPDYMFGPGEEADADARDHEGATADPGGSLSAWARRSKLPSGW